MAVKASYYVTSQDLDKTVLHRAKHAKLSELRRLIMQVKATNESKTATSEASCCQLDSGEAGPPLESNLIIKSEISPLERGKRNLARVKGFILGVLSLK